MRILTVTHYFASHRGGIEIVADQLARKLAETGPADLFWAASDASPPPADYPGACIALACSNLAERRLGIPWPVPSPVALRRLAWLVRHVDLVLIHDALYPTSIAAFLLARRHAKRVVVVQHIGLVPYGNLALRGLMSLANRAVAGPMLSRADRVVYISGLTARYFSASRPAERDAAVIFNGLLERFAASLAEPGPRAGPDRTARPAVAFVGRFVEKKGLSVLERVAKTLPDVDFVLAGWGALRPEDWQAPNVRVRRDLAGADLVAVYRAADLLVLPSVGEGFPLVVQEAMCCGTPVLCNEEVLFADPWLEGRIAAAPVDLEAPDATARLWAERISGMLEGRLPTPDPEPAAARERYSWGTAATRYWELIEGLFDPKQPVSA